MFKDILVPVDLEDETSWAKALPAAVAMAEASGGPLHVMTVVPDFGMTIVAQYFPEDFEDKALAAAGDRLKAFVAERVPDGIHTQTIVGHGRVYDQILRAAGATGADLIVIAAHRPDLKDYLLGPNAARVVRHGRCSVLVVRD